MKFHFSSFLLGSLVGASGIALEKRARPVLIELATAGFRVADSLATSAATAYEDMEDLMAEARARARPEGAGDGQAIGHKEESGPHESSEARGEQHG